MTAQEAAKEVSDLRKAGRLEEALEAGRAAWKTWGEDQQLRQAVGWCLYERVKAASGGRLGPREWQTIIKDLTTLAKWAQDSATNGKYSQYDAFPLTLVTVMRAAGKTGEPENVLTASSLAEPEMLPIGRSRDFASLRMDWLSHATKALAELRNWRQLLELESRNLIPIEEENDAQWVRYRFALAHEGSGDHAGALVVFDRTFRTMDAPWKRVFRARMLLATARAEEAVEQARRALAATKHDDLLLMIDAVHVIARALADSDRKRAMAHAAIAQSIRPPKGGIVGARMQSTLSVLQLSSIEAVSDDVLREQAAWWKAADESARMHGTVAMHLPNGGAGFIKGNDGKDYYFSKKRDDTRPLFPVGTNLSFEPLASFDEMKQRHSWKAIKLRKA